MRRLTLALAALLLLDSSMARAQCPTSALPPQFAANAQQPGYFNGNGNGYSREAFAQQSYNFNGQPFVTDGRPIYGAYQQYQPQPLYYAPQQQRRPLLEIDLRIGGRRLCPCCGRPF